MRGKYGNRKREDENSVERIVRVNEILKREIADLLERESFNENGILVSVTKVECATSLKSAGVFISIFGGNEEIEESVLARLGKLRGEIQRRVSRHIVLKYTPVLQFVIDRNIAEGDRVLQIIRELEEHESH